MITLNFFIKIVLWFYMQIYRVCRIFESSKGLIFCLICMFSTTDVTKVFQNYIYFVPVNSFINPQIRN